MVRSHFKTKQLSKHFEGLVYFTKVYFEPANPNTEGYSFNSTFICSSFKATIKKEYFRKKVMKCQVPRHQLKKLCPLHPEPLSGRPALQRLSCKPKASHILNHLIMWAISQLVSADSGPSISTPFSVTVAI